MDRLRVMEAFVAVAEAGSFARGAARMGVSPPSITRAVSALEERLGERLFTRTTRSLNLTEVGQRFLESCRRLLAEIDDAERAAIGAQTTPSGRLTLTASAVFGRLALAPIVREFLAEHPRVDASLLLVDRVVNLVDEGVDVGVRIGELADSSFVARRVGSVRRVFVASPDYLARRGEPASLSDLAHHQTIAFTGLASAREWRAQVDGRPVTATIKPRLEVNDAQAAMDAAVAGEGVTLGLCYMMGEQLRDGRLAPVLKQHWPSEAPVHIVFPDARLLAAKVRSFVDWAAPKLARRLKELSAGASAA